MIDPQTGMYVDDASPFPNGVFGGALKANNAFIGQDLASQANAQRMLHQHAMELQNQESEQQLKKQQFEQGLREQYVGAQQQLGRPQDPSVAGMGNFSDSSGLTGGPTGEMDPQDFQDQSMQNALRFGQQQPSVYGNMFARNTTAAASMLRAQTGAAKSPAQIDLARAHADNLRARTEATEAITPSRVQNLDARTSLARADIALKNAHTQMSQFELLQDQNNTDPHSQQIGINAFNSINAAQKELDKVRGSEASEMDPKKKAEIHADVEARQRALEVMKQQMQQYITPPKDTPSPAPSTTTVAPSGAASSGPPPVPAMFAGSGQPAQGGSFAGIPQGWKPSGQ